MIKKTKNGKKTWKKIKGRAKNLNTNVKKAYKVSKPVAVKAYKETKKYVGVVKKDIGIKKSTKKKKFISPEKFNQMMFGKSPL